MTEDPMKKVMEAATRIANGEWTCSDCGSNSFSTADFYLLKDDSVLEHIRCAKCDCEDHTARLHMRISFPERKKVTDTVIVCKECGGEIVVWGFHPYFAGYCPDCDAAKTKSGVEKVKKK